MKFRVVIKNILVLVVAGSLFYSCGKDSSSATGWAYNNKKNGGFERVAYTEQETGPGLILIEGGTYSMGRVEQDVMYDWNNMPRRVTVHSFYMDETEVKNIDYREYLYWIQRVWMESYPEVYRKALPDTLVWRQKLSYNEPYVEWYLRHPAYEAYPVVGINWLQANDFCTWRTDRVNEMILIREGIFKTNPQQKDEDNFNTESYLLGQYQGQRTKQGGVKDYNPNGTGVRNVRLEDGIVLPRYRLPTEAEWEYAALALVGNTDPMTDMEIVKDRKLYPWTGHIARNPNDKFKGDFLANFRRGRGDYMGSAGRLNDNADITAGVFSYWPNDYGLYNMAGNVSEWVLDTYRPLSMQDFDDLNPYRGNQFKKKLLDADGYVAEKDSLGKVQYVNVTDQENLERRNYKKSDYRDYIDGDYNSSIYYNDSLPEDQANKIMYEFSITSIINNNAKVVKGGSWKDPAYWMVPGTRRFLDEKQSTAWIGFRCAMDRVGSPVGLGTGKFKRDNVKKIKRKNMTNRKLLSK
jgi:gliding motility-associated lipoprotein GldJ